MIVLKSVPEIQAWRRGLVGSLGFVPTMGALHAGHASLLSKARAENENVLLSIFVNPTQFNNPDDLKHYPKTWDQDLALAKAEKVDAIFAPRNEDLYHDQYAYQVRENKNSLKLCGRVRPGHFDGVLSVVMKLFQLADANNSYFGEKDYQQLALIRGMTEAFFLKTKIVPVPTVREADGLAMSSRNVRLTDSQRKLAPQFFQILKSKESLEAISDQLASQGFRVDYVEELEGRRFGAVFLGEVRLIDNVEI